MNNALNWSMKILAMLVLLLAPIKPVMIAVGFALFGDMITGVWAAIKRKEKITSTKLRRTISKLVWYEFGIVLAFVLETYLVPDIPFVKMASGAIGITEAKSLMENLSSITGTDFAALLIDKLQGSKYLEVLNKKDEPPQA